MYHVGHFLDFYHTESAKNEWECRTFIDGDGQKQFLGNEKWSKSEIYVKPYFDITFLIDWLNLVKTSLKHSVAWKIYIYYMVFRK